jgi:biopolymer transport protein TolQ
MMIERVLTATPLADAMNPFQYALQTSTSSGLGIVIALGVMSIFSWAVMITKWRTVQRASRAGAEFLGLYRRAVDPLQIYAERRHVPGAPVASVYIAACRELCLHLTGSEDLQKNYHRQLEQVEALSPTQLHSIEREMERTVGELALRLESKLTLLATAVSGGPFLGLLGTVWGVMDTFVGVANSPGVPSIKEMAPGVSASLVTTVIGLLVAIPAMFGYNLLINRIREIVVEMENFSAELSSTISKGYVDHHSSGGVPLAHPLRPSPSPAVRGAGPPPTASPPDHHPEDDLIEDLADEIRSTPPPKPRNAPAALDDDEEENDYPGTILAPFARQPRRER